MNKVKIFGLTALISATLNCTYGTRNVPEKEIRKQFVESGGLQCETMAMLFQMADYERFVACEEISNNPNFAECYKERKYAIERSDLCKDLEESFAFQRCNKAIGIAKTINQRYTLRCSRGLKHYNANVPGSKAHFESRF